MTSSRVFASTLCVAISAALVVGMPCVAHAGPRVEGFEEAMARAGALVEEGKHEQALGSFEVAFEAMPPEIQVGEVGEFVAYSGARSAIRAFDTTGDSSVLERGRALLGSFVGAVEAADESLPKASTDRARSTMSVIDGMLAPEAVPPVEGTEESSAEPSGTPVEPREPAEPSRPPKDRAGLDRAGLALTIVGGLAAAGGIGTIIAGARQVPWYEGELESFGWDPDATDYDYEAKLDEARRVRNIDIGVGAGLAVVGVGLLVYGAIRLESGGRKAKERAYLRGGVGVAQRRHPSASLTLRF